MNPFDSPTQVEDRGTRARAVRLARERGVRLPTFAELADPRARAAIDPRHARRDRSGRAARVESLSRQLVQRHRPARRRGRAGPRRGAERPERRSGAHRGRARRAVPDDRCAQGARRLCLPRAAPRIRPLRSDAPARGLALDRQLLPRRRRDLAHPRVPRRRGAAGRHERRTLRVARALGREPGRHRSHPGHRVERQGDLRSLRRARARSGERDRQPVQRVRELPRPLALYRTGARARVRCAR